MGRDESPADVQLTRAFIAVAARAAARPLGAAPALRDPNVRTALPELRALAGIPTLVI